MIHFHYEKMLLWFNKDSPAGIQCFMSFLHIENDKDYFIQNGGISPSFSIMSFSLFAGTSFTRGDRELVIAIPEVLSRNFQLIGE